MNIVNITLGVDTQPCSSITLGRRGENEVTQVVVDFSSWAEEFGTGVITLLAMRSRDSSAYPVVLTLDGNTATWDVTSTDTAFKGGGRAEYIYTVGNQIAKSVVFSTVVLQDIGEPSETPPDPYEDWLERLTELGAETQANAEAAQQSAEDAEQSAQEAAESAASVEGAVEQAEAARDAARAAQAASESARDAAQTAQASAEASATSASGSATSAAGSATSAAGSASDASSSASAASASATTASTAATAAQTAQSAAEDAAEDAQQAAQQAHVEYEQLSGEVDDLSDEVAQQKSAIDDLTALTNRKAGMLVDTASGAIASFVPDSTIPDLLGVSVDIEPQQDLHGYESPWPAGGGKNKCDGVAYSCAISSNIAYILNRTPISSPFTTTSNYAGAGFIAPVKAGQAYAMSSDASGSNVFYWAIYASLDDITDRTKKLQSGSASVTFTADYDGYVVFMRENHPTGQTVTWTYAQLEAGSTTTAYAPFENLCPISGWDNVEVDRTGVNLFDGEWEIGSINTQTGQNAVSNTDIRIKNFIAVKPGSTVYRSWDTTQSGGVYMLWMAYKADKSFSRYIYALVSPATLILRADECYLRFYVYNRTTAVPQMMINYGTAAKEYKPYSGNRYTIQLGQTIYGGTLDVTAGTLTVDRAMLTLDGTQTGVLANWAARPGVSGWLYPYSLTNNAISRSDTAIPAGLSCDVLPAITYNSAYAGTKIGIGIVTDVSAWGLCVRYPSENYRTLADINALLSANPMTVVYKLATPITIQLDPVTISTIANQTNNVWSNAGNVSVEYAADLKAYIDRLNQPTEDDMIANTLIAANKYFTVNNRLFLSTASIAVGAQIIPGTNCTETSLVEALNALNA